MIEVINLHEKTQWANLPIEFREVWIKAEHLYYPGATGKQLFEADDEMEPRLAGCYRTRGNGSQLLLHHDNSRCWVMDRLRGRWSVWESDPGIGRRLVMEFHLRKLRAL